LNRSKTIKTKELLGFINGRINSTALSDNDERNDNRQTRYSRYLKETNHTLDYGINNPLNRGIRIFNSRIDCYDKNNIISVDTFNIRFRKRKLSEFLFGNAYNTHTHSPFHKKELSDCPVDANRMAVSFLYKYVDITFVCFFIFLKVF
jgi:hypothetical protein